MAKKKKKKVTKKKATTKKKAAAPKGPTLKERALKVFCNRRDNAEAAGDTARAKAFNSCAEWIQSQPD